MDPGQIAELRRWARGLESSAAEPELRAAARAILLLADEVDRLAAEAAAHERSPEPPPPEPRDPDDSGPPPPLADRERVAEGHVWDTLKTTWSRWRTEPEAEAREEEDPRERRRREFRRRRRRRYTRLVFGVALVGALVFAGLALAAEISKPTLHATGPAQGALIGPSGLQKLTFSIRPGRSRVAHARWTLDGDDVTSKVLVAGDTAILSGKALPDGRHRLSVRVGGGFLGSSASRTWQFVVDTTPPQIAVPAVVRVHWGQAVRIAGRIEPGASLAAGGKAVPVDDGRFALRLARRPSQPVLLTARDRVGNVASRFVSVVLEPRLPPHPIRAVHVTFYAWATASLRDPVLDLIDQGKIDAVELDLKDESGTIGFDAPIALGKRIGAVQKIYDLNAAVRLLHSKGVRVMGRLVCFRDSVLAGAAWKAGDRDEVVQTPNGGPYAGYGGFTNFANPVVRKYNIDVAVAAAKAGVDEILYDYVRRPDGPISTMVFSGLKGTPEEGIVQFLAETRAALKPYPKVFLGASVFGVAATRPTEVAQDIPHMAEHVDYIAPMVYPSHWAPGEYGVPNPNAQPYDIVARSLKDFENDVRGTGARVVPWLQDFSLGVDYGPQEVRAEIQAARDMGIDEFLLWDPNVTYTADALDAGAAQRVAPEQTAGDTARAVGANELGLVPVLMHHQILPNGGGDFDQTPAQFLAELTELWREGYYPVRASDLVSGQLDVPAGKSPVVLTFDDSTNNQLAFLPGGRLDPTSAIGILEEFSRAHPGFPATGTFFVLREPFTGNGSSSAATLRWLAAHGFELGDHTKDHTTLRDVSDVEVQRELVLGRHVIVDAVPGYRVRIMALPRGSYPKNERLAMHGAWGGESYSFDAVFLAGAEAAHSPFSTKFDPTHVPRIGTFDDRPIPFGMRYWLDLLKQDSSGRYVSDGDPRTISFPRDAESDLAARFRARANPY